MHRTLTSVVALAGLAAAGTAQAEQADAVIAGDIDQPMLLTDTQMDAVTAGASAGTSSYASGYGRVYTSDFLAVGYGYASASISASIVPTGSLFVSLNAFANAP
jgi:hypothetical protein